MKYVFTTLMFILGFLLLLPAQELAPSGIFTDSETAMTVCPFDSEAAAVVLLDEAVANYDDNYSLITNRHIRIKILKESGFKHADTEITFYRKDNFEVIDKIEAMVTNTGADGKIETEVLDKKSFYKKDLNEFWGAVIFTFPKVKAGSIIEYKYRSFMKSYSGLEEWKFHDYLPVVKSAFRLYIPPRLSFAYQVFKAQNFPITVKNDEANAVVYFEMNNLPGLENEPYMDARKDYLQKVTFQLNAVNNSFTGYQKRNTTWKEVINDFLASSAFGTQLRKNLQGADGFLDEVKKMSSEKEKMNAVYEYVRNAMSWNGFNSRYAGEGVKDAWNKKTGTNGEINLILLNLLKEAGLDAHPLLVSERWHGKVNTAYPFIDQFNTVFAYVLVDGKPFYLDASDKYTPAHIIPKDILNTKALLVQHKSGGIIDVVNNEMVFFEYISTLLNVDAAGKCTGEAGVKSDGYARIEK